jgi:hypothetical protein
MKEAKRQKAVPRNTIKRSVVRQIGILAVAKPPIPVKVNFMSRGFYVQK